MNSLQPTERPENLLIDALRLAVTELHESRFREGHRLLFPELENVKVQFSPRLGGPRFPAKKVTSQSNCTGDLSARYLKRLERAASILIASSRGYVFVLVVMLGLLLRVRDECAESITQNTVRVTFGGYDAWESA